MDTLIDPPHVRHPVVFDEDVGAVRRAVARLAATAPAVGEGDAELVVTELATNIVRHAAGGGYVLVRRVGDGIELVAADHGASTRAARPATPRSVSAWSLGASRGLGAGLATVARSSTAFDCYSTTGGTVVLSRLGVGEQYGAGWCRWGGVNVPRPGEIVSGDAWTVAAVGPDTVVALLVDGLGHGEEAAKASAAAVAAFEARPTTDVDALLRHAHDAMRQTRGGVVGVAILDRSRGELVFAGVGNVTACVVSGGSSRYLPSRDGVLGGQLSGPRAHPVRTDWEPDDLLVLASDGVRTHWGLDSYPKLLEHDPAVVAATVQRDHERGTDDVAVLALRDVGGSS